MKPYVWTLLFLLIGGQVAFSQQTSPSLPNLPSLQELVQARLALLQAKYDMESHKDSVGKKGNSWVDKLFWDRITGTYSYGKGVKFEGERSTIIVPTESRSLSWLIAYSMPLNVFRQKTLKDAVAGDERGIFGSMRQLERQEAATKINGMYSAYLESKRLFLTCPEKGDDKEECVAKQGYAMRKQAVDLLLLTGLCEDCLARWACFLDEAGCLPPQNLMHDVQGK